MSRLGITAPMLRLILWQRIAGLAQPGCSLLLFIVAGCSQGMWDNSRTKPLEENTFFADRMSARQPVAGTVARGQLRLDAGLFHGKTNGQFIAEPPMPVNAGVLERGHARYEIFCAPCHDGNGAGNGIVVQRGFPRPLPLTEPRLVSAPAGYHFDVITRGFQTMFPMAGQIPVTDRWAIVVYVRALQRGPASASAHAEANRPIVSAATGQGGAVP